MTGPGSGSLLDPAAGLVVDTAAEPVGARIATSLQEDVLRRLFGVLLFGVAAQLAWRAYRSRERYPESP